MTWHLLSWRWVWTLRLSRCHLGKLSPPPVVDHSQHRSAAFVPVLCRWLLKSTRQWTPLSTGVSGSRTSHPPLVLFYFSGWVASELKNHFACPAQLNPALNLTSSYYHSLHHQAFWRPDSEIHLDDGFPTELDLCVSFFVPASNC